MGFSLKSWVSICLVELLVCWVVTRGRETVGFWVHRSDENGERTARLVICGVLVGGLVFPVVASGGFVGKNGG